MLSRLARGGVIRFNGEASARHPHSAGGGADALLARRRIARRPGASLSSARLVLHPSSPSRFLRPLGLQSVNNVPCRWEPKFPQTAKEVQRASPVGIESPSNREDQQTGDAPHGEEATLAPNIPTTRCQHLCCVLHDWSDEDWVRILKNCRDVMSMDPRLLIAEQMLEPDPKRGRPTTYLIDVQMMAMFGNARGRTPEEFDKLLHASGFNALRLIPTSSVVSIIEAAPA
ncbi:methyltransferase [Variovorax sp. MHTC-1]|uniref:methyltransferase n=1 Tax=Variovorax sp. MHTC-1 TaxID=2495593 RepID=UPI0028ACC821|nr:methyltransferase [Variovorax sp. MHTC-1]